MRLILVKAKSKIKYKMTADIETHSLTIVSHSSFSRSTTIVMRIMKQHTSTVFLQSTNQRVAFS